MSEKAPQPRRRRRKPSAVNTLRPFWFLLTLAVVVIAAAGYFLSTWRALYPHAIDVSGNHVVPRSAILDAARVNMSENLWMQNVGGMAHRIELIPYIDTARVHRRLPATVVIDVTERTPFAVVRSGNDAVTVDDRLRVVQNGPADGELPQMRVPELRLPAPGAVILSGPVESLAHILQRAQSANLAVDAIEDGRYGDVTMTLRSGVRVMLGDASDLEKRLSMIEPILTQVQRGPRRIAAIDLRAIATPVVVFGK